VTVLVIGATGRVGGEVARRLARQGRPVRALARDPAKAAPLAALGIEIVAGDLVEPASLACAFAGIERVFLASALDPRQAELQGNAVEAARRAGVRHVVKLSGLATGLDSSVASGLWHARTEQQIERSGMAWTHLRPHFFFQNLLGAAPLVAGTGVLPCTTGAGAIAGVDARDVAECAAAALAGDAHLGCAYTVTGPESFTYAELADRLSALLGRAIHTRELTPEAARARMVADGMPAWHAELLAEFAACFARGGGARITDAVQRLTGRAPRSVGEFLREHAAAFGASR
jgi:uncharacterized protein YbjT (DUF2867 family)